MPTIGYDAVMDLALLVLRVVVGGLLVGHGTQKLFGWFGGHGVDGTARFMRSLGYHPPRTAALAAGASETVGGALLALGLFTPLGTAMVVGAMVNAIMSVHADKGPWVTNGGYELPLTYAAASVAIAAAGPGLLSFDAALGAPTWGGWPAVLAALAGVIIGAAVLSSRRVVSAVAPQAREPVAPAETRRAA